MNKQFGGLVNADHFQETSPDQIDRGEVMLALSSITTSERFRNAERICDFLRYVVEETLDGRNSQIKAQTIAIDVFRRQNFDDDSGDSIVRTSAHRLRLFLEGYYNDEGVADAVRIVMPKGTYVPRFYVASAPVEPTSAQGAHRQEQVEERKATKPSTEPLAADRQLRPLPRWRRPVLFALPTLLLLVSALLAAHFWPDAAAFEKPRILVTLDPGLGSSEQEVASELQRRLISSLVSFGSATIVDEAYLDKPAGKDGLFTLEVSLTPSDPLMADWKLTDAATGAIVWTGQEQLLSTSGSALESAGTSIASKVVGQEGAIAIWSGINTDANDPRHCLAAAQMRSALISDDSEKVRTCLEALTKTHPNDAVAWALLSMTYYRLATGSKPWAHGEEKALFALQQQAVERAVKLNPDTYYTWLAQLFDTHARNDRAAYDYVAQGLLDRYSGSPSVLTQVALKWAQAGEVERALKLFRAKIAMGATLNAADNAGLALIRYHSGDYAAALPLVERISDDEPPLAIILKVATYGQLGMQEKARKSWATLLKNYPDTPKVLREVVTRVSTPADKTDLLLEGVRKAGVL